MVAPPPWTARRLGLNRFAAAELPLRQTTSQAPTMHEVLAIHEGRGRRVVNAILHYEPGILRGLTWSHFGYVALLAIAFGVARAVQDADPFTLQQERSPRHSSLPTRGPASPSIAASLR